MKKLDYRCTMSNRQLSVFQRLSSGLPPAPSGNNNAAISAPRPQAAFQRLSSGLPPSPPSNNYPATPAPRPQTAAVNPSSPPPSGPPFIPSANVRVPAPPPLPPIVIAPIYTAPTSLPGNPPAMHLIDHRTRSYILSTNVPHEYRLQVLHEHHFYVEHVGVVCLASGTSRVVRCRATGVPRLQ